VAYTKVNWKARQGIRLNKYAKTEETPNSVILVNAPEQITEEGTPISAENLNNMDEGIANLDEAVTELTTAVGNKVDKHSTDRLMTAAEGTKLSGIETGAQKNPVAASTSAAGLMSADDKTKLNGIASGAQQNPGTATSSAAGLMSASDKSKLDGLSSAKYLPAGTIVFTALPTEAKRTAARLLDLNGRGVSISLYPDLYSAVYNSSDQSYAPAFYRCTSSDIGGGSRSASGSYLKLPDCRGMFLRGLGANGEDSTYTGGGYAGTRTTDAEQAHTHYFNVQNGTSGLSGIILRNATGASGISGSNLNFASGSNDASYSGIIGVGSVNGARTSTETRPASISLVACIAY
jgi:hypothetical protein